MFDPPKRIRSKKAQSFLQKLAALFSFLFFIRRSFSISQQHKRQDTEREHVKYPLFLSLSLFAQLINISKCILLPPKSESVLGKDTCQGHWQKEAMETNVFLAAGYNWRETKRFFFVFHHPWPRLVPSSFVNTHLIAKRCFAVQTFSTKSIFAVKEVF